MPDIYELPQIKKALENLDPIRDIEDGFVAYSQGKADIPPVGELSFSDPPGEMHIKYGCIRGGDYYVTKIASGFYENHKLGLPNYDGLMLVFSQKTGFLECILLDEGHLTNVRTAAAGAVCAKHLAPKNISAIGVFGAGVQGRLQVEYLKDITPCRKVFIWGISEEETAGYKKEMDSKGYDLNISDSPSESASGCNLMITATPSRTPLLFSDQIRPGTHITAMGSDTAEKQELDPGILSRADRVVVDSKSQCLLRGEVFRAIQENMFREEDMVELGRVITNPALGRRSEEDITVADLTGVAVQDIQIAKAVYLLLKAGGA